MKDAQWIIVAGNPVGGFLFFGPFTNSSEALEWTETNDRLIDPYWWLVQLEKGDAND